jgi:hypothetical protein
MSISRKHYIGISNSIRNNFKWVKNSKGEFDCYIDTNLIDDLCEFFRDLDIAKLEKNNKSKLLFNRFKFVKNSIPQNKIIETLKGGK